MRVCHCYDVSDRAIRSAMDAGAVNEHEVGEQCGAGTGCGGCLDEVRRLCNESRCAATASMLSTLAVAS